MSNLEESTLPDNSKLLIEWALAAGRSMQSKQTGFIHFYHGDPCGMGHQTIPLQENFLFALALLRSRLMENVLEGKTLLKRLFAFQNKESGDFPLYMHEYPDCRDPAQGIYILSPLFWILKQFGHVLGNDLKQQAEHAAGILLKSSLSHHENRHFPYFLEVRLRASESAFGALWNNEGLLTSGLERLNDLSKSQLEGWQQTVHLGEMLMGLHMLYPSLKKSPWSPLWKRLEETWHLHLGCYIGPNVREWQEGENPVSHFYDLFSSYCAGEFPSYLKTPRYCHLQGILIHPFQERFSLSEIDKADGFLNNQKWELVKGKNFSYTLLEKNTKPNPSIDKTHTPFRLVWKNDSGIHTFICQGGSYEKANYKNSDSSIELIFDLSPMPPEGEKETQNEIEFFIDHHPDVKIEVDGTVSNTWKLGQTISLDSGSEKITLSFHLVDGQGEFMGHVMRGNRPSQVSTKGDNRFSAYDWNLFLRTIRRMGPCKIQVKINLKVALIS